MASVPEPIPSHDEFPTRHSYNVALGLFFLCAAMMLVLLLKDFILALFG
jgi:hypothetical protein